MSSAEKAINAVNQRIERLQANLREAKTESAQRFLFESVLVTIGIGEALSDYIKMVGAYAQRRHAELKETNAGLAAQHGELLKSGQELLEQFKANPADKALRKALDAAQKSMANIQKTVRRGANALQREIAPGLAMVDRLAQSVRKFVEADQLDALKRGVKAAIGLAHEFYVAQRALPLNATIDAATWEKTAAAEIDQAGDFYDAYARTGYQTILVLETMRLALCETPPQTLEETTKRANESVAARIKEIAGRFSTP